MCLSFQGYGGPLRRLLDNRVMAILSRLTYGAYLVHPAVIWFVMVDQPLPVHYSTTWYSFHFLGMLLVVFALSAILFVMVEKPFSTLERLVLIGKKEGKKREE